MNPTESSQRRARLLADYLASEQGASTSPVIRSRMASVLEETVVGRSTSNVRQVHLMREMLDDLEEMDRRVSSRGLARAVAEDEKAGEQIPRECG